MLTSRVALKTAIAAICGCVLLGGVVPAQAGHSTGTWKYYQPYPVVPGYPPVPGYAPPPPPRYDYDGYRRGYRDGYREARPYYGDDGYYAPAPRYPYYPGPRYDED